MSAASANERQQSRILFVKNLGYDIQGSDLYELFGKYGAIRQIRIGDQPSKTKGTAYVVFEEVQDAKNAVNHLNGFNLAGRYIVVLFHHPAKQVKSDLAKRELDLQRLKEQHEIQDAE